MPRQKKNAANVRIQLKPSGETLAALLEIALRTEYRGNTAIIEAAVQRWAAVLQNGGDFLELLKAAYMAGGDDAHRLIREFLGRQPGKPKKEIVA